MKKLIVLTMVVSLMFGCAATGKKVTPKVSHTVTYSVPIIKNLNYTFRVKL